MRNTKRWMWHIKNTTIIATKMAEDLFCRLRTNWAPLRLHFLVWKVSSHLIFNISKATYIQKGMKSSYFISFLYTCCFYWKKAKKKENLKLWSKRIAYCSNCILLCMYHNTMLYSNLDFFYWFSHSGSVHCVAGCKWIPEHSAPQLPCTSWWNQNLIKALWSVFFSAAYAEYIQNNW